VVRIHHFVANLEQASLPLVKMSLFSEEAGGLESSPACCSSIAEIPGNGYFLGD
jgi:hypothetical protein